jgi:hypothetical protein
MATSTTVHEELIEIKFETDQGKMKLAELHAQAEALLKLFGGPIPVLGGGGAGGGSSTISSTAMMQQHAAQAAQAQAAPGGGAVSLPPAPSGGATVSSGALARGGGGGGATVPSGAGSGGGGGGGATVPSGAAAGGSGGATTPSGVGGGGGQRNERWSDFDIYGRLMSNAMVAPLRAMGAGYGGTITTMGSLAAGFLSVIPFIGDGLAAAVNMMAQRTAEGLDIVKDANRQRADVDWHFGMAQLSGVRPYAGLPLVIQKTANDAWLTQAARYGMNPQKAIAAEQEYLRAAGGRFGWNIQPTDWLHGTAAGIAPSSLGRIDALRLMDGATGSNDVGLRLAGGAQGNFGVQGGLDAWLQKLTMHLDRFVERGLRLNLDDVAHLLERVGADPLLRQRPNEAPKVIGAMGGVLGDAKSQLLAPFAQLGNAAVMMKAMEGGGGIEQWFERLEKMGPTGALDAIRELAGDMAPMAINALFPSLRLDEARHWGHLPGKGSRIDRPKTIVLDGFGGFGGVSYAKRRQIEASDAARRSATLPGTGAQHQRQVDKDYEADAFNASLGKGALGVFDMMLNDVAKWRAVWLKNLQDNPQDSPPAPGAGATLE